MKGKKLMLTFRKKSLELGRRSEIRQHWSETGRILKTPRPAERKPAKK